jgi:hypothetical protein
MLIALEEHPSIVFFRAGSVALDEAATVWARDEWDVGEVEAQRGALCACGRHHAGKWRRIAGKVPLRRKVAEKN